MSARTDGHHKRQKTEATQVERLETSLKFFMPHLKDCSSDLEEDPFYLARPGKVEEGKLPVEKYTNVNKYRQASTSSIRIKKED
jgi:hypothetical protein